MALVTITPLDVHVACDLFDGVPRGIRIGGDEQQILSVGRVREEVSAYPSATGPRTLFEVETPASRLRLAFHHRTRRWVIDALDDRLDGSTNMPLQVLARAA
jgi:hypothetical protein